MIIDLPELFGLALIVIELVYCSHQSRSGEYQGKICTSHVCNTTAASILDAMDMETHPCDDFYQYACGNYMKNQTIPKDKSRIDTIHKLYEKILTQLRGSILDGNKKSDPLSFKKLSAYYEICSDNERVENNSEKELRRLFRGLGGWPVLERNWNETDFDWRKTMYKFRESGLKSDMFINVKVTRDYQDNKKNSIHLAETSTTLSPSTLAQNSSSQEMQAYFEYMVSFAETLGAGRREAEKDLRESLNFEVKLAELRIQAASGNTSRLYHQESIANLQQLYPDVSWQEYLTIMLGSPRHIQSSDSITIRGLHFLDSFFKLLKETPTRVLANYAFWNAAAELAGRLSLRLRRLESDFLTVYRGGLALELEPRWSLCARLAQKRLPMLASSLYIRRHFDGKARTKVVEIVRFVKQSIRLTLENASWIGNGTRLAALEKLEAMQSFIAYPEELLDNKLLDRFYDDLEIYTGSFLETELSTIAFNLKLDELKFKHAIDKTDWLDDFGNAAAIDAFYSPIENAITVLGGMLQGAYFDAGNPEYFNFAGIGSIIGHEMMHGFDANGRRYDKRGDIVNWWDLVTEDNFRRSARCYIHQYRHYGLVKNISSNAVASESENIADNAGLKQAYLAYKLWSAEEHLERPGLLPGLDNLTPQQTFWLAHASSLCVKEIPGFYPAGPHAPNQLRVLVPLVNSDDFSRDFACPLGSPMNPRTKCFLW
ncbi:hypothetical protein QAD02_005888 [Eretmocerus hayati]|uniref:Uncharacterized protein n=1 Tax=Eretmocerus hayati TaxID=131215 RepID=A0ACC2N0I8_9HYME|nr:hypothetical protein QAD02_005888 [Eretmocerus hayati]